MPAIFMAVKTKGAGRPVIDHIQLGIALISVRVGFNRQRVGGCDLPALERRQESRQDWRGSGIVNGAQIIQYTRQS